MRKIVVIALVFVGLTWVGTSVNSQGLTSSTLMDILTSTKLQLDTRSKQLLSDTKFIRFR